MYYTSSPSHIWMQGFNHDKTFVIESADSAKENT